MALLLIYRLWSLVAPNSGNSCASVLKSVLDGGWLTTNSWPPSQLVDRLNYCWPSPAETFLASFSSRSMSKIFILSYTHTCFKMGPHLRWRRGRSFYVGATFVALWFQHEYICAVTVSRSLRTLWTLCHSTILSYIYTKYTEVFCQCRLVQQVKRKLM
jgi:hypothetical protein